MALTIGIVGLPNVGKSTLFNALTKNTVLAANYPFATIDPNVGVVDLPDARLQVLSDLFHSERIVPAAVSFVDIAGIVKGASEGEGLGNQFLANIREADAIAQVVRGSPTPTSSTSRAPSTRRPTSRSSPRSSLSPTCRPSRRRSPASRRRCGARRPTRRCWMPPSPRRNR
ncbi:hypothetical protein GCM10025881_30810 [Pseudolysinimonas kribbensis]|uniref:OBG-type G domain-containing protein n=1 Tax=Pseudolysinimonas kribbensis TaxID=433641 RepID=A0ABQ6KCA7_9MICO|nr:hypothetical protein GCM10025881_30810 [Pseudolysinimonas kribbensis]